MGYLYILQFPERKENMRFKLSIAKYLAISVEPGQACGYRAEAPHPRLILVNHEVLFDYIPSRPIHPDILALICLIVYYPFFQKWTDTHFPSKISPTMASALAKFPLYTWDGSRNRYCKIEGAGIIVPKTGIDPDLAPYKNGATTLLAFGGGLDSTAVKCLFPGAHIVHEKKWNHRTTKNGVDELISIMDRRPQSGQSHVIASNSRSLTRPTGWTGWISCIATSLLVASDHPTNNILLGSSLASLLGGGKRFIGVNGKEFPGTNIWTSLLKHTVGINLFCPVAGLSEVALVKIIKQTSQLYLKKCTWCLKKNGYPCHSCFKCLRRDLLIFYEAAQGVSKGTDLIGGTPSPFPWSNYSKSKKPPRETFGPTLNYLLKWYHNTFGTVPPIISSEIEQDVSWIDAWYVPALSLVPENLKTYVYKRIAQRVRPMSDYEKMCLENYGQEIVTCEI